MVIRETMRTGQHLHMQAYVHTANLNSSQLLWYSCAPEAGWAWSPAASRNRPAAHYLSMAARAPQHKRNTRQHLPQAADQLQLELPSSLETVVSRLTHISGKADADETGQTGLFRSAL